MYLDGQDERGHETVHAPAFLPLFPITDICMEKGEIIMEEQIHKHINDRPDSITIGTPSKGGELKVYFNAKDPIETNALLDRAFTIRKLAQEKYAAQVNQ